MSRSGSAREKWARIIGEQRRSGLSIAAFCGERGVAVSSFYPWKRRLAGHAPMRDGAPRFVEATIREAGGAGGVTIEVGAHGPRITVMRGFDRRLLLDVLGTLALDAGDAAAGGAS